MTALKYMQAIVLLLGILVPALKTTGSVLSFNHTSPRFLFVSDKIRTLDFQ